MISQMLAWKTKVSSPHWKTGGNQMIYLWLQGVLRIFNFFFFRIEIWYLGHTKSILFMFRLPLNASLSISNCSVSCDEAFDFFRHSLSYRNLNTYILVCIKLFSKLWFDSLIFMVLDCLYRNLNASLSISNCSISCDSVDWLLLPRKLLEQQV